MAELSTPPALSRFLVGNTLSSLALVGVVLSLNCKFADAAPSSVSSWDYKLITAENFRRMDQSKIPTLSNGIPKILHQTWRSDDILPQHRPFFVSWDKFLPEDWLHVLWTDDEADSFVREKAPPLFMKTYDLYAYPIQRIDTFRYVLLKEYGGMYSDLDNELFSIPQFPALSTCQVYLAETCCGQDIQNQLDRFELEVLKLHRADEFDRPVPNPVQNSLMLSIPNHPFWDDLLNLAVTNGPANHILQRLTGIAPIHSTVGVDLLTSANYLYGGDLKGVCELEKEDWHGGIEGATPPRYTMHHGTHVWESKAHNVKHIIGIIVFFLLLMAAMGHTYFAHCSGSSEPTVVQARQMVINGLAVVSVASPKSMGYFLLFSFITILAWVYM